MRGLDLPGKSCTQSLSFFIITASTGTVQVFRTLCVVRLYTKSDERYYGFAGCVQSKLVEHRDNLILYEG
jgi:hypothetical protein